MADQHTWRFELEVAAVFVELGGQYQMPDIMPKNLTKRDATTITHARANRTKKYEFNRQIDGQEFTVKTDYVEADPVQLALAAVEGDDAGINARVIFSNPDTTRTYTTNLLVGPITLHFSDSQSADAKDEVSYTFKVNADWAEDVSATV